MNLVLFLLAILPICPGEEDWGFYGHRLINRHAVYSIPAPLNQFFRKHVQWLEEHGVDADKRRYAIPQEYKRHYIDLDYHRRGRTSPLSRSLEKEIRGRLQFRLVVGVGDTLELLRDDAEGLLYDRQHPECSWPLAVLWPLVDSLRSAEPEEERWVLPGSALPAWAETCPSALAARQLLIEDHFSPHGILPYWLEIMQRRLTQAFVRRDIPAILRLAADMGHYIGDAHVPLHTTENYNGQLTGQHGIHGFWESRIPELFYGEWELITGPAEYISNFQDIAWQMVEESHTYVESVLRLEREVRDGMPKDRIMCFEDRNLVNTLTYCPEFARAYARAMDGMVEERFRASIHAIGSAWYTAWIDAGQPVLWNEPDPIIAPPADLPSAGEVPLGRPHE